MITFGEELPNKDDYFSLFETTGWNQKYQLSPEDLVKANLHSWLVVCAYDADKLVGFGRVVTDHVMHAMIFDMIVQPEYQHLGIGTQILTRLVDRCLTLGIKDIQLFCAAGKRAFYEKNGFEARPEDAPGMQFRFDRPVSVRR
ncbi:MAG: GNAT family N-acetyltransferase [Anaerolineales bacterium]|jgi:GNAT superfamily N-acetyltransferase